ncbi:MAG: hypothetical protein KAT05_12905 [Spirochaetes bacterium]|nr:hypothetical protein [Spirochaetota bacterium]
MYHLKLKSNVGKNIFSSQKIYWYPLVITPRNDLISINISTIVSYKHIKRFWASERVNLTFPLDNSNYCFFYFGSSGDPQIIRKVFKEKPLLVDNNCLNYFYSEREIKDLYNRLKNIKQYKNIFVKNSNIEDAYRKIFKSFLTSDWDVEFYKVQNLCQYCTEQIALNPILHLVNFTQSYTFSKRYYKKMLEFLLIEGFLIDWIEPKDASQDKKNRLLNWCDNFSENEIKSIHDLNESIKEIVTELFDKYEFFRTSYLAAQCGTQNSIFKKLITNLYSFLPKNKQNYIKKGYYPFQPKLLVKSIELDFIKMTSGKYKIHNIMQNLKKIFNDIESYEIHQHKILKDETDFLFAKRDHYTNRYRFLCTIKLFPYIDYLNLADKISELGYAIRTILSDINLNNNIKEMWVKKIELEIITPPQFEEDAVQALASNWLVKRTPSKDRTDEIKYLFSWDEIPGKDNIRLIDFLKLNYNIDWVKSAKIEKIDDVKTIRVSLGINYLSLSLNDEKTKVNLKIDDGRTDELIADTMDGKLIIYLISKKRFVHIELACDYPVFQDGKFLFSYEFLHEIQHAYSMLNKTLNLKHNYNQFSKFELKTSDAD